MFLQSKYIHPSLLINSLLFDVSNTIKSLDSCSTVLHGWLPRGNIFALLVKLYTRFPNPVVFSHRSSFLLFQSFFSQLLLFLEVILSSIFRSSIYHIANSSSVFTPFWVRNLIPRKYISVIPNGFQIPLYRNLF